VNVRVWGPLCVVLALAVAAPAAADPVLAVWYRGDRAGAPRESDLAVIRALGFTGVAWPTRGSDDARDRAIQRMADAAGLRLLAVDRPQQIDAEGALRPGPRADISVKGLPPGAITALAWRAVAHGARTITFDAGEATGTGLERADRSLSAWAREAVTIARQLTANGRVIDALRPGPGLVLTPAQSPRLDVILLDAGRSWVLVATNASPESLTASVRLPAGVPYALWLNWLDGTTLAMVGEAAGPRWTLRLGPHGARVYLIDKGTGLFSTDMRVSGAGRGPQSPGKPVPPNPRTVGNRPGPVWDKYTPGPGGARTRVPRGAAA
jgi:hypothetical protein